MEHGAYKLDEEQSHVGMIIKTEVEEAAQPTEYIEIEVNVNCVKEEPGLVALVTCKPGLLVKVEVDGEPWQAVTDSHHSKEKTHPERGAEPQFYGCDKCQKVYSSKANLRNHCRQVHGRKSQKCGECNVAYRNKAYLQKHVRNVHSKQQYACAICRKMCKSKEALSKHVATQHRCMSAGSEPRIYICNYCQMTFTIKTSIRNHIACVHASISYKCSQCAKSFQCERYLKLHTVRSHTAPMQVCNVCGKSMRPHYLKRHMRSAHSDKRLPCYLCGAIMKSKLCLRQHLNDLHGQQSTATSTLAITSSINVAAGSVDRDDLIKDEQGDKNLDIGPTVVQHVDTYYRTNQVAVSVDKQERITNYINPILCNVVGKYTEEEWRGSPLYRCDQCLKTYKSKKGLNIHRESQHESESHKCAECNREYSCRHYLMKHVRVVHGKCQYECTVCKKIYKSKEALGSHFARLRGHRSAESHQQSTCSNFRKGLNSKCNCQKYEKSDKRTCPTVGDLSAVASSSTQQHNEVVTKEESADGELALGPVVFQHVDCNFRSYKEEPQLD